MLRGASRTTRWLSLALLLAAVLGAVSLARAEGQLRIAEQFGIVYLLLNVAEDQHLIEKAGRAQGQEIKVEWLQLFGGSVVNDALLAGSIDIGAADIGPLLTLWDRTRGRQEAKGVASLGNLPYQLVTNNPRIKTLDDFSDADRIALPAVGVSVQARLLQLASARRWGVAHFNQLDRLQVAMPHPDATAAVSKGGTEVDAHFSAPPFQQQALAASPLAHAVLDSYQVLGGPASATALYATARFRRDNPKTYRAFIDGLAEAVRIVNADPQKAVESFVRVTRSKIDPALLLSIVRSPQVQYKLTPQNNFPLADFMFRIGALRNKPASAADYFFDDPHNAKAD